MKVAKKKYIYGVTHMYNRDREREKSSSKNIVRMWNKTQQSNTGPTPSLPPHHIEGVKVISDAPDVTLHTTSTPTHQCITDHPTNMSSYPVTSQHEIDILTKVHEKSGHHRSTFQQHILSFLTSRHHHLIAYLIITLNTSCLP